MFGDELNFSRRGRLPVIQQTEAAECGLACLAMIASFHGHRIDLNTLRRRHPVSLKGVTLRALIDIARHLHLACRPLRLEPSHLTQIRLPAIMHWDMNHFVVLKAAGRGSLVIHDPALGERRLSWEEAAKHLSGIAVEIWPVEGFTAKTERARLPFWALFRPAHGTIHALAQIFALSIVLEIGVIAAPFYVQLAIDHVIASGDRDLLSVLAIGFGLLTAIMVASSAIRSLIILILENTLSFEMGARLFRHLIRLPLSYFEKRHIGDVLSRFVSLDPIRSAIARGLISALIDGLMCVATLAMVFLYSAVLGYVVLAALIAYAAVRLALYRLLRERTQAVIQNKAQEESTLIETLRAVQSLKIFNRESEREAQWLNRYAGFINAAVHLGRAQILFKALNDGIFGVENIVAVYIAVRLTLDGQMTVGMIFAVLAYKHNFMQKAVSLVEQGIAFRILDLHLERLSDIAMTPMEGGHDRPIAYVRALEGGIELRNVSFRYAETEPYVLERVNLSIKPGQFVTIMGPSGGGKTTLVKIMLGLLEPVEGEVLVDGTPLSTLGLQAFREQIGAVMQEDQLLSGSIADNISFFDTNFDPNWMIECAQLAGVHDEIMLMPMTYNSLIGDMGSSLSGGQKQRVMLARALYRRPKLLFLDEGTAHLDVAREQEINANLRALRMTRISVAHRPEISAGADQILWVARTCHLLSSAAAPSERRPGYAPRPELSPVPSQ